MRQEGGLNMKQEIITYLSTCREELIDTAKYLYLNPEESYKEHKSSKYIIDLLKKHGFCVEENFLNIDTAFKATLGEGHPKICYICEYDAIPGEGHITGHNLLTTMSLCGALGLSKVIDKVQGTIVVLGCPGEYLGGAKITMCKQGVFKDIDLVLMAHPDIETNESGTSNAILPINVKYFKEEDGLSYLNPSAYTPLDATILTFNMINALEKGFHKDATINGVLSSGGYTPLLIPKECESRFYIRGKNMSIAEEINKKLKIIVESISSLMSMEYKITFYELPYDELITNSTLSRIFSHNLKENGIINIGSPTNTNAGLSLGSVSHLIPCIHPYISIVEDQSIKYATKEFAEATTSPYALDIAMRVGKTLATTALDLIEKQDLINESKTELIKK